MHFDALTLACITHELTQALTGGRVQQVLQPDEQSIGLEIYAQHQRHYLLLTVDAQKSRVHLVRQKLRRGAEQPSPLLLLLRKYVRDSLLEAIVQPDPTERVLQLRFVHLEHGPTTLVAEMMGQRSNLLLVKPDGKILDCLRRVWAGETSARALLPGQSYTPPPAQAKLSPLDDGSPDYYTRLGEVTQMAGKLWKVLTAQATAVSPTLAREIAWRATGNAEAAAIEANVLAIAAALQELWAPIQTGEWQPGIWLDDDAVVGFSAYPAHVRGRFTPTASLSEALEQFFAAAATNAKTAQLDPYAGLRGNVAAELRRASARLQKQLAALASDEPPPGGAEQLRTQAEWLLALNEQIQSGQTVLEVDLGEDTPLQIALDPHKTPIEQAQQMFKTAGKWERAVQIIPERRAKLQSDLAFLEQLNSDLKLAENQPEIAAVREELQRGGFLPRPQKKAAQARTGQPVAQPLRFSSPQGFAIVVGRNARQNELVTFKIANAADLWLHVRNVPGSHVVIRNGGQPVNEETLRMAAQLAAYYSSVRGEKAVEVSVTERRFVTRVPNGHTGQVYIRNEETITVPAVLPEFSG
ncbi:MAG: NFACT RNA binding domain-containing protein [Caldilineaceae bacterium]